MKLNLWQWIGLIALVVAGAVLYFRESGKSSPTAPPPTTPALPATAPAA